MRQMERRHMSKLKLVTISNSRGMSNFVALAHPQIRYRLHEKYAFSHALHRLIFEDGLVIHLETPNEHLAPMKKLSWDAQ